MSDKSTHPLPAPSDGKGQTKQKPRAVLCRTRLIPDTPITNPQAETLTGGDTLNVATPHQRLATAIADLMRNEDGGISVGLEGSWGSGKTSVIRLLENELRQNGELVEPGNQDIAGVKKKFTVINFDAWAHEKDPLRRTFLETLIPHLWQIGWVEKEEWRKRLDIIAQRLEEKTTSNSPQVGAWGVAFGVALILAAVGSSVLSAAAKDIRPFFDTSLPFDRKFAAGLTLVFSPALVVLLACLARLVKSSWHGLTSHSSGNVAGHTHTQSEQGPRSVWAMLFNKGVSSERTRTFKTTNPTSIEFESEFRKLMEEALEGTPARNSEDDGDSSQSGRNLLDKLRHSVQALFRSGLRLNSGRTSEENIEQRRVVLVLDNLDRVQSAEALSIWSTLQTFLGHPAPHNVKWFKQLWVIVLYDPRGIRLLWDKPDEKSARFETERDAGGIKTFAKADITGEHAASTNADKKEEKPVSPIMPEPAGAQRDGVAGQSGLTGANAASISFMDKSFQIRFEVPPPVLSDWRQSLQNFLATAFPDNDHASEFDDVQTVLELQLAETGQEPTFRELKLFVNQIGSLHRQWARSCDHAPEEESERETEKGAVVEQPKREKRFPLAAMAFYVLQRRRGVDVLGELFEGRLIGGNYKGLFGENPTDTLAALAYNVGRAKAGQLLLEKPIEDALRLGAEGAERLANLERIHGEGFWVKLRVAVHPNRRSSDAPTRKSTNWVGNAAQALLKSGLLDPAEKPRHLLSASVVRRLCVSAAAGEITEWPGFDAEVASALAALLRWKRELGVRLDNDSGQVGLEEKLLRSVAAGITPDEKRSISETAKEWLTNLALLRREMAANQTPGFDESAQIKAILDSIAGEFRPGGGGLALLGNAKVNLLEEILFLLVREGDTLNERFAAELITDSLVEDGHIGRYLEYKIGFEGINEATLPVIARCLRLILINRTHLLNLLKDGSIEGKESSHLHDVLTAPDEFVAEAFVALLEDREELKVLLNLLDDDPTGLSGLLKNFVAACLQLVILEERRARKLFGPREVVNHWPALYRLLNGDRRPLKPLLVHLVRSQPPEEFVRELGEKTFAKEPAAGEEYWWLYAAAVSDPNMHGLLEPQVAMWKEELQKIRGDQWLKEIRSSGGRYELMFALSEAGLMLDVPALYKQAVINNAIVAIKKKGRQVGLSDKRKPTDLLDRSKDRQVFDQIYNLAAGAKGNIPEVFFNIYGDALADPERLTRDGFAKIFFPVLQQRNAAGLRWMRQVLANNMALLDNDLGLSFKLKVGSALIGGGGAGEDDEAHKELVELAKLIGAESDWKGVGSAPIAEHLDHSANMNILMETSEDEKRYHNDAHRYARLLVSEIKLYYEQKVKEGRHASDLYDRLREEIDRSRQMYDRRVSKTVALRYDYFDHELVDILAEGDRSRMGKNYPGPKFMP